MFFLIPWLTLAIFIPIISGLLVLVLSCIGYRNSSRITALIGSISGLLIEVPILIRFDQTVSNIQFEQKITWFEFFKINYHVGIDGISILFTLLTAFFTVIVIITSWNRIKTYTDQYMALFLILSGLMIGTFVSLDGMLFYIFFEAVLIPMYIIIGIWGGENRFNAAYKFFIYTLVGSVLFLIAIIYLRNISNSFDILFWHNFKLSYLEQILIFFAFFAAFAIKIPMWPVHTWLPSVHVEAPTEGSVILAAIMLKIGAYGFLRFSLPIVPDASKNLSSIMITLSLISIIYISLITLVQNDIKRLTAYSSIAHMSFVTLGIFIFNQFGMEGAIVQMFSHGLISGSIFLCIGSLYERIHSRLISDYGGVINTMPQFVTFFTLFSMANIGLPGTSGFVGEFLIIVGSFKYSFLTAFFASTTLVLGASYSLWMLKRVAFGKAYKNSIKILVDINSQEFLIFSIISISILIIGIYPRILTDFIHVSVDSLLDHVFITKL